MGSGLRGEKLIGIFFLASLLMSFPMLTVFNVEKMVAGIPLLYLYVFVVWFAIIILIVGVIRGRSAAGAGEDKISKL